MFTVNIVEAVWSYPVRSLTLNGTPSIPINQAEKIAQAIWSYSLKTLSWQPRTAGSYGSLGRDLSVEETPFGATHITCRTIKNYDEVGKDIFAEEDSSGAMFITGRDEGNYGEFCAKDNFVNENLIISNRTEGSYGDANQSDEIIDSTIISNRTDGSYGSKGAKSIVTYTQTGAIVIG